MHWSYSNVPRLSGREHFQPLNKNGKGHGYFHSGSSCQAGGKPMARVSTMG